MLEIALEKDGLKMKYMDVATELDSTEAIISSVESGLGIGFVTRAAILPRLPLGKFATAKIKGLHIPRRFLLVYPAGPKPEGLAGAFREFTLEHAHGNWSFAGAFRAFALNRTPYP